MERTAVREGDACALYTLYQQIMQQMYMFAGEDTRLFAYLTRHAYSCLQIDALYVRVKSFDTFCSGGEFFGAETPRMQNNLRDPDIATDN